MTRLTDEVRKLFDGKNFAVLSTLEPDGRPHSTVTWVKRDADDVLFALPRSRRKTANLIRDPRAAVVIFDAAKHLPLVDVALVGDLPGVQVCWAREHCEPLDAGC